MPDGFAIRIDNLAYNSAAERAMNAVSWMPGSSAVLPRAGVKPGAAFGGVSSWLSVLTSPDRVTVPAHGGMMLSTPASGATSYQYVIGTAVTKSFAARPASGTSRIDLIVVRVYDAGADSSTALKELDVEIIAGTAAASPVAPSQPNGTLLLGVATVPNSAAIVITTPPPRTVSTGGIVPVANATDLATLVPYNGMKAYQEDTNSFMSRVNGAWVADNKSTVVPLVNVVSNTSNGTSVGAAAYTNESANGISQTFTAPGTSVRVTWSAFLNGTGNETRFGFKISGGLTRDPNLDEAAVLVVAGGSGATMGRTFLLTGLTAGTSYTLTSAVYNSAAATVSAAARRLLVEAV